MRTTSACPLGDKESGAALSVQALIQGKDVIVDQGGRRHLSSMGVVGKHQIHTGLDHIFDPHRTVVREDPGIT